jgi:hypothetical protein
VDGEEKTELEGEIVQGDEQPHGDGPGFVRLPSGCLYLGCGLFALLIIFGLILVLDKLGVMRWLNQ